uniref:Carboxylesterase type B domain-containing protein n=2 Tax=Tetranychus urticae TaxID=32264 RepID=T1JSJ7_TETUR
MNLENYIVYNGNIGDIFSLFSLTFSTFLEQIMHSNFVLTLLFGLWANVIQSKTTTEGPIVLTRHGAIQGSRSNVNGFAVERFLGIRYGLIPRRFVHSQVNNHSWTGILNATKYGSICPQDPSDLPMDEDCLFINIWRPAMSGTNKRLLPVLFWAHGSGYQHGSGAQNSGDLLAPYGNMVVVTFNYRLRSFGYAFGDENEIQGNQAVSDIISALKWVHQNIAFFGGDPSRVTYAGHSAGSMMGSIIPVLTALDDSLYSQLWLTSGVCVTPMYIEDTSVGLAKTKLLASKVGCGSDAPGPLTSQTISCLQTVDMSTILEHDSGSDIKKIGGADDPPFLPVYGTPLIPKPLVELFKSHPRIRKTTILNHIHQDEEGLLYSDLKPTNISEAYKMAFDHLAFVKKDLTKAQMQPFFEYYFNETNDSDPKALKTSLTNFLTDYTWGCTSLMLAELYSTYHSVRFGVFTYNLDKYGKEARPNGPYHGDEIELFFGEPFYNNPYSSKVGKGDFDYSMKDKIESLRLMKSLVDYVHGKMPTDWPELHFNKANPEKEPVVRIIDLVDKNVRYSKQHICRKWSKLFGYDIAKD